MATKKKAAPKKRAARYVVVTFGDGTGRIAQWRVERGVEIARATTSGECLGCLRNGTGDTYLVSAPRVGESVTITIHGTTKEGYIGGPGGLELPTVAKRGKR